MIQNSIDRLYKEQVFVKFLLTLTKILVPTFAFPLVLRAKNEWEKNVNLDNFSKLSEEKLYCKTTFCTVNFAWITFHLLKKSLN